MWQIQIFDETALKTYQTMYEHVLTLCDTLHSSPNRQLSDIANPKNLALWVKIIILGIHKE